MKRRRSPRDAKAHDDEEQELEVTKHSEDEDGSEDEVHQRKRVRSEAVPAHGVGLSNSCMSWQRACAHGEARQHNGNVVVNGKVVDTQRNLP